MKLET